MKVVVFQCPCGTPDRQRSPRGERPRKRDIFVERPVSSMKTSLAGSRSSCQSNQSYAASKGRLAPAPMHVRSFLNVQPRLRSQTSWSATADRYGFIRAQAQNHLVERDVLLHIDPADDKCLMRIQPGARTSALFACGQLTLSRIGDPGNGRRNPNSKPRRRRARRHPACRSPPDGKGLQGLSGGNLLSSNLGSIRNLAFSRLSEAASIKACRSNGNRWAQAIARRTASTASLTRRGAVPPL